jgi:O-succinylbenzoate synthase
VKAHFKKYELHFKRPATTSRGTYKTRTVWFLMLEENGVTGVGECAPLPGLSSETPEEVEQLLKKICTDPRKFIQHPESTQHISSVHFGLETAVQDLQNGAAKSCFPLILPKEKPESPLTG